MKQLLILLIVVAFSVTANAQFTKATLKASGLTCSMCSKAVKVALEKVDFVQEVKVDIKSQDYILVFKQSGHVEFDALSKAVEDAGFSVGSLKVTGTFDNLKIEKDEHVRIGNENFHFLDVKSQVLQGEQTITIVDKDFVTAKHFKKICESNKMSCVKDGKSASCCVKEGFAANERVYHVTI